MAGELVSTVLADIMGGNMTPPPDAPLGDIVGIIICLLFSAFFSGTETALTALSASRTQQLIDEDERWNRSLKVWLEHSNRTLTTLLVGNNLVNILGSILAGRIAHHYLDSYADAAAVAAMTLTVLVLGEVTPKTYAKHNPERVAVPAMRLVRFFIIIFFPVAWVLSRFGSAMVRLVGGKTANDGPPVTEGEIEYMIELGKKEGVFEEQGRGQLLQSALEFSETIAKEAMIPRTEAHFLQVDTALDEALSWVTKWGHSRVPIYAANRDEVVGVLYAKDLLQVTCGGQGVGVDLEDLIRPQLLLVPETQRISRTLRRMKRHRIHMGIVLDEFGGTSGLITIEDIIEELVGEIRDEFDHEEDPLRRVDDSTFTVDPRMSVFELGERLGVDFPDEGDYESLGGFITARLGRVPEQGAEVLFRDLRIVVVDADERRVIAVRIERSPEDHAEGADPGADESASF